MKKMIIVFAAILSMGSYAQNQRFVYEYKFVKDSTARDETKSELMFLDTAPKGSKFYSHEKYVSDSLREERIKIGGRNFSGINFDFVPFVIEKSYPDYNTVFYGSLDMDQYKVSDGRVQNWKIVSDKAKIGDIEVQKATLDFSGRKWIAWFAPDIPIQDGPYKFHGLPGLIIKIEDQTQSHSFTLKETKKLSKNKEWQSESEKKNSKQFINVTPEKYKKQFLESRNDPAKGLKEMASGSNKIMLVNESGKPLDISEVIREREKNAKAANAKDNNILELDLLQ
ncbi:hypothetical protein IW15_12570 [Chryseobacterium soli]|uniref:GLPGLI family protein n=1 Tax=Chryseobacterium soli TaxID=445961 RepID=A0A086A6R9_9FLAO|nr:GLPGLI family protein [Chryseobacterium soli]KFF12383.1 hypothetical protein IW15_12570 [Chryseobacterium soli]